MPANKTLIIFGPGKHFGFHIAKRFAHEGFHIIFAARDYVQIDNLVTRLSSENLPATSLVADVSKPEELKEIVAKAIEGLPPVHVAIFNVKSSATGNGLTISPKNMTEMLAANVSGAIAVIQACAPVLALNSSIILTGGGFKDKPDSERLVLSVSKGALHTLFLSMIEPLNSIGIKLKTVVIDGIVRENGPIKSEDVADAFWDSYLKESSEAMYISSREN